MFGLNLRHFAAILMISTAASVAFAADGGNTSGGGERVGKILRDLVDNGVCVPRIGKKFAYKQAALLDGLLKDFEKTNFIFALELRAQINELRFCPINGQLRQLNTNDLGDYVYYTTDNGEKPTMVGIRDDNTVYVDSDGLEKLEPKSKAFFFIHEAMHAFIPNDADRRNHKVRSIVRAIEVAVAEGMDDQDFSLAVEHSDVRTTSNVKGLEPIKQDIYTIMSDSWTTDESKAAALRIHRAGFTPERWFPERTSVFWQAKRLYEYSDSNCRDALWRLSIEEIKPCIRAGFEFTPDSIGSALRRGNFDIFHTFMETPSPYHQATIDSVLFSRAIETNNLPALQEVFNRSKFNVSAGEHTYTSAGEVSGTHTLFAEAVGMNNLEAVKFLMKAPTFDPTVRHVKAGYFEAAGTNPTVVDLAIYRGNIEMARLLESVGFKCERLCSVLYPPQPKPRRGH